MKNVFKGDTSKGDSFADRPSTADRSRPLRTTAAKPLLIAAAVLGTAICARQLYRYMRPKYQRPKWKSKSRHPQISRWESEGGDVPRVEPLGSQMEH